MENGIRWPQIGLGGFFPSNPDLADILGRTDLNFENCYFFHFLDPKFPDFQVPRFPDAAAAGRTLRSQPDPSPSAPRDQLRRKGPCCDEISVWIPGARIIGVRGGQMDPQEAAPACCANGSSKDGVAP